MSEFWKKYWKEAPLSEQQDNQAQVGRTRFGKPIDKDQWNRTLAKINETMDPDQDDTMLDLCCGNGLQKGNARIGISADFFRKQRTESLRAMV